MPPGYTGDIPDGYFLLTPSTSRNLMFLRGSIAKGLEPAVKNITANLKVYPLKDAPNPAETAFENVSNKAFNTVFPCDLRASPAMFSTNKGPVYDLLASNLMVVPRFTQVSAL